MPPFLRNSRSLATAGAGLLLAACAPFPSDPLFAEEAPQKAARSTTTSTTTTTVPNVGSPLPPAPASGTYVPVRQPSGISGCQVFPKNSVFHADIRNAPLDPDGDALLGAWESLVDGDTTPKIPTAEFAAGYRFGMPINVVDTDETPDIYNSLYHNPSTTFIDDAPLPSPVLLQHTSDRHALVLDTAECTLHEMLNLRYVGMWLFGEFRGWVTDGAGQWDLGKNDYDYRSIHPTSSTATALPILPSLLTVDDVLSPEITHSLRFSVPTALADEFRWPARRTDGSFNVDGALPQGLWLRLPASFDDTDLSPEAQRIVRALKVHGMRLDDTGGNDNAFTITAELSGRWDTETVADPAGGTRPLSAVLDEVADALTGEADEVWDVIDADDVMTTPTQMSVK